MNKLKENKQKDKNTLIESNMKIIISNVSNLYNDIFYNIIKKFK